MEERVSDDLDSVGGAHSVCICVCAQSACTLMLCVGMCAHGVDIYS